VAASFAALRPPFHSIIIDRLHPLYDLNGDLEPFTLEQLQDAADSDVPQQLLHWRAPRARPRGLEHTNPWSPLPLLSGSHAADRYAAA
jgi:hypothetical protein